MKRKATAVNLSRRERQILDAIYRLGSPTAVEIRGEITDPPSLTAVRTLLTILEQKGHVRHREDGPRYLFEPTVAKEEMGLNTLQNVLQTFFQGSLESAVSTLITHKESSLDQDELDRIQKMIDRARESGK